MTHNQDDSEQKHFHQEILYLKNEMIETSRIPAGLRWFDETESFETMREADEWISSDAYNKIGHEYDGYRTTDPKMAYSLVFQLVRAQTLGFGPKKVHADEDYSGDKITYLVWVES